MRCKTSGEFSFFTINTPGRWREGWADSLFIDAEECLSLAATLHVGEPGVLDSPTGIALDARGDLFVINASDCQIYKLASCGGALQRLSCSVGGCDGQHRLACNGGPRRRRVKGLFGCGCDSGEFAFESAGEASGGLAFGKETLYVADPFNHRVQGFYVPKFQLRLMLGKRGRCGHERGSGKGEFDRPKDLVADSRENLYVLDYGNRRIQKFDKSGRFLRFIGAGGEHALQSPESIAVDKKDFIYVVDAGKATVERFGSDGVWQNTPVEWEKDIPKQFRDDRRPTLPSAVAVGDDGVIYVGERDAGEDKGGGLTIHQFAQRLDHARRYLGHFGEYGGGCFKIVAGRGGRVYASCGPAGGVLLFGGEGQFEGRGTYHSKVFDSTVESCAWHRLDLDIEPAEKSALETFFRASDEQFDQGAPEGTRLPWLPLFSTPSGPVAVEDALFRNAAGRYLQLKFVLTGDGFHTHRVKQSRVYFERDSYLRYLPATYQEDEAGRDFLERFLSIFESMSLEVEQEIEGVAKYFDPRAVSGEFLEWLGTWLAVLRDNNWPEKKRQELLGRAFQLYAMRGTTRGLREMVTLFTGGETAVVEHHRLQTPMVLRANSTLGLSTVVGKSFTKRLVLEESSRIGEFSLIETDEPAGRPFEVGAYDFTVVADASGLTNDAQVAALRRLVDEESPAHTRGFLRAGGGEMRLGVGALLQVDSKLSKGFETARLGLTSRVGTGTFLGKRFRRRGVIGTRSTVAVDTVLH